MCDVDVPPDCWAKNGVNDHDSGRIFEFNTWGLSLVLFFQNSSRTGACGMANKLSLLIPLGGIYKPWNTIYWGESLLGGCWYTSCSVSEGLFGSGFWGLPVLISCVSGYLVSFVTLIKLYLQWFFKMLNAQRKQYILLIILRTWMRVLILIIGSLLGLKITPTINKEH